MKILFIGSKKFDYLQDLTYSGLVKILGVSNIIELNWAFKKHIDYYKYPKNIAYYKGYFFKSFFAQLNKRYDLVLVSSSKCDTFNSYLKIIHDIPINVPIIYIDGGDRDDIGGDLDREGCASLYQKAIQIREFNIVFKREMIIDKIYPKNTYPLPLSFNFNKLPYLDNKYKYDVTFWAGDNHEIRHRVFELLKDKFDTSTNGTFNNVTDINSFARVGDEYLKELNRSKIALNFRGGGWDTMRYWEIPAVSRLMISGKPKIQIPYNFIHEKTAIFCNDDMSDLIELIEYYLKYDNKREYIAQNAKKYTREYHSDIARARYILNLIQNILIKSQNKKV